MLPRARGVGLLATLVTLAIFVDFAFALTVTVDDADPAITYSTATGWNVGNTCTQCTAQPSNRTQINDQTWHDDTRLVNGSEIWFETNFTGTAVTVYGILIDFIRTDFITNVNLTLNIDGKTSKYNYTAVSRDSYQYQVPVFNETGLNSTLHTMRVTLNPNSSFLFDYLVYTATDGSGSTVSTGVIVGIVAGVVGLPLTAIAILLLLRCYKKHRDRQSLMQPTEPTAFPHTPAIPPYGASSGKLASNSISAKSALTSRGNLNSPFGSPIGGTRVSGGMGPLSSYTGSLGTSNGNPDHYDPSASPPPNHSAAPGVGGRDAPWVHAQYPRGIPAPVQLVAPIPVPLGDPRSSGREEEEEDRPRSESFETTRSPTAPPPYTPPPRR